MPQVTGGEGVVPTSVNQTTSIDACALNPCSNGGTCTRTAVIAGFECACTNEWTGPQCQWPAPGATGSQCLKQCSNRGQCASYAVTDDPFRIVRRTPSTPAEPPASPQCQCPIGYLRADCSVKATVSLCPDSSFCLYWNYDAFRLDVQIVANTTGWFGVVLNANPPADSGQDPIRGDALWFAVNQTHVTAMDGFATGQGTLRLIVPTAHRPPCKCLSLR